MQFLGRSWRCECGLVHEVPIKRVLIGKGAVEQTPDVARDLKFGNRIFLLADETTYDVAGARLRKTMEGAGFRTHPHVLEGKPIADGETADAVEGAVSADDEWVVSCGSGTITDLGKWAAFRKGLPHIAVATAPSMNGYASGIVALTRRGLKTTQAAAPPLAVIADVEILKEAPIEMIRAGLGDILSKPVSNADWRLSSIVKGDHFCTKPFELVDELESRSTAWAFRIGRRDPDALAALAEALVCSGISMVIAGSSAPASGGEHLISHFLDMRAMAKGRDHRLHGEQVGVATVATARLYERLLELSPQDISRDALNTVWERGQRALARCDRMFGRAGAAIASEYGGKRGTMDAAHEEVDIIAARWEEIKKAVSPFLKPADGIRAALESAGAPASFADLEIGADDLRDALVLAMTIRSRYTVLDLAFAVGELDAWAGEIIEGA